MNNGLTLKLRIDADGKAAKAEILGVGNAAEKSGGQIDNTGKAAGRLATALGGILTVGAVTSALKSATQQSLQFNSALDEVSTLISSNVEPQMTALSQSAKDQAIAYGSFPTGQVEAQYQIISAGAADAAEATATLDAANRLAVGGVTDVLTAADGLTSVMNAYGDEVESATSVSDTMFIGMKAGKTTIGQLSSEMGKVAPLAATAGVSFDELTASVAALTKGGVSTSEAVTGVRAIIAAVVKPTKEATDMAAALGLEFNAQALEAKGLSGFLQELKEKTGGNTETMAQLFGGVEALTPALALTGKAGESFAQIMEQMKNKAGATDEAFDKIASGSAFQLKQIAAQMAVATIDLGDALLVKLNPAISYVNDNFDELAGIAKDAVTAIGLLMGARALTGLVGVLGSVTVGVNAATTSVGLLRGALALLGGPITIAVAALGGLAFAINGAREEGEKLKKQYENGLSDHFKPDKSVTELTALKTSLQQVEEAMATIAETSGTASDAYQMQADAAERMRKRIADLESPTKAVVVATEDSAVAATEATAAVATLTTATDKQTTAQKEAADATRDHANALQSIKDRVNPAAAAYRSFQEDVLTLQSAIAKGDKEALASMDLLAKEYAEKQAGMAEKSAEAAEETASEWKQTGNAFEEALTGAIERVDASFASAWRNIGDGFGSLRDGIVDSFKDMLAEMAHQAITRPITVSMQSSMAGAFGMPTGTMGTAGMGVDPFSGFGGGGMSGIPGMSSISNAIGYGTNYMSSIFGGAGSQQASMLAAQTGEFGMAGANATTSSLGGIGGSGASMAGIAGAGLAGYAVGDWTESKLGGEAQTGSTIGAMIGMATPLGPIGAAIGSALGSAVGSLFGGSWEQERLNLSLSGTDIEGQQQQKRKRAGRSSFRWGDASAELEDGLEESFGQWVDVAQKLGGAFGQSKSAMDAAIDNFTADGTFALKGKDPSAIADQLQAWVDETGTQLLAAVMPSLAGLIDGAGDRVGEMVNSLFVLADFVSMDFAPAAQTSLWDAAKQQLQSLNEITAQFDGSVDSANEMANQAQLAASAVVSMVGYIEGAQTQISGMLGQTYNDIWTDTQSASELYSKYAAEADYYAVQMQLAASPDEVAAIAVQFNSAVSEMYRYAQALDADGLMANFGELQQGILTFIDDFRTTSTDRLESFRSEIISDQQAAGNTIEEKLAQVSADQQAAAASLNGAAANLNTVAQNLNTAAQSLNNVNTAGFMSPAYFNDSGNWG